MLNELGSSALFRSKLLLFFYALILILCYLLFLQGDLAHTASSSYAYLGGHFKDFYDYNQPLVSRNDYLPLLYLIYAAWNIPLLLFGYTNGLDTNPWFARSPVEILWWKILLIIFFFATAYLISKIGKLIDSKNSQLGLVFATSPIAIFIVFIFSQYDIISVFFSTLGVYYFLRKKYFRFSFYFSVAISIKYFALVIFLPLLLLGEKNILNLVKYFLIGISITLIQLALYWHSAIFKGEIFQLATGKLNGSLQHNFLFYFTVAVYFIACVYLRNSKFKSLYEWRRAAVFFSLLSYLLMFFVVPWHPQWLIIIVPFLVLSYSYIASKKTFLFFDVLGMLFFVWYIVNKFAFNVDVSMAYRGALKSFLPDSDLIISDLYSYKFSNLFHTCFNIYLASPFILVFLELLLQRKRFLNLANQNLIFIRFLCGMSVFILPAFICIFLPTQYAKKINPSITLRQIEDVVISNHSDIAVGPIYGNNYIQQTFISKHFGLNGITLKFSKFQRKKEGELYIRVFDGDKILLSETLQIATIKDNTYYLFKFPQALNSFNVRYKLVISSSSISPNSAISMYISSEKSYMDGELYYGSVLIQGDLVMTLNYDKNVIPL